MMLLALFLALLVLIFVGVPIILALGLVGLAGILLAPGLVLALYPQKMFTTLDSFSLLALPYFILAGELMAQGGISRKLVDFAETVVGHFRGGLAHANVVSSMVFAGVSGSSTADTSAIGAVLIPAMKEKNYPPGYAAALCATAGTIGAIIPPSMTMIVYGSLANVSIGGLFLGGIVPGALVGFALMLVVWLHSRRPARYPFLQSVEGAFSVAPHGPGDPACVAGAAGPRHHHRRHPGRRLHRDRGGRRRLHLRLPRGPLRLRHDRAP